MVLVVAVLLTVVLLVTAYDNSIEFKADEVDSKLEKSIRHKLMQDNYDYSREVVNDTVAKNTNKNERKKKKTRKNFYVSDLSVNEKDENENITAKANKYKKKDEKNIDDVVSKNDLLYYIDDEHFHTEKSSASTAKYKFLKDRKQYRRSGQARLIQEENKEGVAIVNLDEGPFPQLRLPNSRRQYMHDHGDAMTDDEELPPPTVNTSDPEAAADDIDNQTEIEPSVLITNSF